VSVAAFALVTDTPAPIAIAQDSVMSASNFLIIDFSFVFPFLAAICPYSTEQPQCRRSPRLSERVAVALF